MRTNSFAFFILAIMHITAFSSTNYMFPSYNPPANLKPSDVPQYICFLIEDNCYSGLKGTRYEHKTNQPADSINRIEGFQFKPDHVNFNVLNLKEGDIGISWIVRNLFASLTNPDGTKPSATFFINSGYMASVSWRNEIVDNPIPGEVYGWKGVSYWNVDWADTKKTVLEPLCWGREYPLWINNNTVQEEENHITRMYKEMLASGFEIGNNTIDAMEMNSGVPKKYFPNSGEGFDKGTGKDLDLAGEVVKEEFLVWDTLGWDFAAGCKLSKEAWKSVLQLGESDLKDSLQVSILTKNLSGFRAPRFESNDNLLHALKESGYDYDCSMHEHYFLSGKKNYQPDSIPRLSMWPYTLDNGSPSQWDIQNSGEGFNRVTKKPLFTSYPAGLWELPQHTVIVPNNLRQGVWNRAKLISQNCPDGDFLEPLESWRMHGRIAANDHALFIQWGMTVDDFVATMKHTIDLRLSSNKAPFIFTMHSSYLTPMYDIEVLLSDDYKTSYGLVVTNNWNKWNTRKDALRQVATYGQSKNCTFINAKNLIAKMKDLQAKDAPGKDSDLKKIAWTFFTSSASTAQPASFTGDIINAAVKVDTNESYCGYVARVDTGYFNKMDHIELTYSSNAPIRLIFEVFGDKPWEVLLNNLGTDIKSGKIPVSAFHYSYDDSGIEKSINTSKINGIAVQISIPNITDSLMNKNVSLTVKNIVISGAQPTTAIANHLSTSLGTGVKVNRISAHALVLFAPAKGNYSVDILGVNGKVVRSMKQVPVNAGYTTIQLNTLAQGMYFVSIGSEQVRHTLTKAFIVR